MENPIKMDDLGVPLFSETPIFSILSFTFVPIKRLANQELRWHLDWPRSSSYCPWHQQSLVVGMELRKCSSRNGMRDHQSKTLVSWKMDFSLLGIWRMWEIGCEMYKNWFVWIIWTIFAFDFRLIPPFLWHLSQDDLLFMVSQEASRPMGPLGSLS